MYTYGQQHTRKANHQNHFSRMWRVSVSKLNIEINKHIFWGSFVTKMCF